MSEQAEQTNTPTDITKLKKTELIDIICKYEENKFGVLKSELGLPYDDDEEWIEYIKKLQDLNAERLIVISLWKSLTVFKVLSIILTVNLHQT